MLELLTFDEEPLHVVHYREAAPGGGSSMCVLEIRRARVRDLPDGIDALVATSDLQGVVPGADGRTTLLGIALAEALDELAFDEVLPPAERTGVLLAGDLYSAPDASQRGASGDVTPVWGAFAERFAWTAGVAGNHDDVTGAPGHVLDSETVTLGGLRVGGVGLICGNPDKRGRRDEPDQLARIDRVLRGGCDVLVLHEGPSGDADQPGNARIAARLARGGAALTVCGHVHWPRPLAVHPKGQVLNTDSRAIVLTR